MRHHSAPLTITGLIAANFAKDNEAMDAARERGVTITDLHGVYASAHDAFVEATLPDIIATAEARGIAEAAKIVATFRATWLNGR